MTHSSYAIVVAARQPTVTSSADLAQPAPGSPGAPGAPSGAGPQLVPVVAGVPLPMSGVPRTRQELSALRSRRSELSDQLQSVSSRRNALATRLRGADGADRAGLEQHLRMLDQRILQLETDISVTGQQVAAASPALATSSFPPSGRRGAPDGPNVVLGVLFMLGILMPMALAFTRLLWRRASRAAPSRQDVDTAQRLMRLETAVDSIAVEVERVSEGQRFVTKLLSEAHVSPRFDAARDTAPVAAIARALPSEPVNG